MRYAAMAGTGGYQDEWVLPGSPFGKMMSAAGHELITIGGRGFGWDGVLDGWDPRHPTWESMASAAGWFLNGIRYEDLNLIAHSHAGNGVLILAARGFRIRSLTTVGTPCRSDVPLELAEDFIGFHQHIYDVKCDFWGWAGQLGENVAALGRHDWKKLDLLRDRRFSDPRVLNIPRSDVRHHKVLTDELYIKDWIAAGWLANMVRGRRPLP